MSLVLIWILFLILVIFLVKFMNVDCRWIVIGFIMIFLYVVIKYNYLIVVLNLNIIVYKKSY